MRPDPIAPLSHLNHPRVARLLNPPHPEMTEGLGAFLARAVKSTRVYEAHYLVKRLAEDLCLPETPVCSQCPLSKKCPSVVSEPRRRRAGRKPKKKRAASSRHRKK